MTTAQNDVDALNRNQSRVRLPVTTNLTVNAGDLTYWDPVNFTVTPITNQSQLSGTNFLGMALQSNADPIYPGDADQVGVLVLCRGCVWVNTTAGDTYNWFDSVTIGADSQTVTKVGVTANNTIGYIVLDEEPVARPSQATPAPATLAGASGTRARLVLVPNHKYAAAI